MGQSQSSPENNKAQEIQSGILVSDDLINRLEWNTRSPEQKIGQTPPLKLFQQQPVVK
jgi:hypothetical protein